MAEEMIEIDGIEISEDTVKSALKRAGIELKKNELKHGDYGYYKGIETDPAIIERDAIKGYLCVTNFYTRCTFKIDKFNTKFVKKGNIFEDLRKG